MMINLDLSKSDLCVQEVVTQFVPSDCLYRTPWFSSVHLLYVQATIFPGRKLHAANFPLHDYEEND